MMEINPYELDPVEARHQFFDFQERIFNKIRSEMYDVQDDISYIVQCYDHSYDFSDVDYEVMTYLKKNGLKTKHVEAKKEKKANLDYYLAMYFGLETAEHFFRNFKTMDFDTQLSNLSYAKNQLAILGALSPTGEPKQKVRNTKGQSKGGKVSGENRYKITRQRAKTEWEKYKRNIPEWQKYIREFSQYENEIEEIIKSFEKSFDNALTGLRLKGASEENKKLIDEKYTDSTQIPRLAIGWIKEWENLPNRQKEIAHQKRLNRKFKDSPFRNFELKIK
ncbi:MULTISPECIES: hypothetical protein [Acinetobacter]|uniref:DUF1376 domain-containing protein n=1 Tax=Acinetobacter modestus TaxID=1776740 RepID=A0ABN0JK99_9GAMM|nr:hypothetical protein [Acinetobacter modestus]ENU25644.1 hypothetical protein F992_03388 [Acinetobacter modestus]GGA25010.1 hypothetical protein GCM10017554_22650 [Acinetobacter modestus]